VTRRIQPSMGGAPLDPARRGPHPEGSGPGEFSASRLSAAAYPEAVDIAALLASPAWRRLADGDAEQKPRVITQIGMRLGRPDYQPPEGGDRALDETRQRAFTQPPRTDLSADQRAWIDPPSASQRTDPGPTRPQRNVVQHQPPRRQRRAAPPPHPALADPRLVTADGRHHRHDLASQTRSHPVEEGKGATATRHPAPAVRSARPAPRTIRSSPAPGGDATAEFSRRTSPRLLRIPGAIR
jgi:hypothetical protein